MKLCTLFVDVAARESIQYAKYHIINCIIKDTYIKLYNES